VRVTTTYIGMLGVQLDIELACLEPLEPGPVPITPRWQAMARRLLIDLEIEVDWPLTEVEAGVRGFNRYYQATQRFQLCYRKPPEKQS
jgi:hypothetical protein